MKKKIKYIKSSTIQLEGQLITKPLIVDFYFDNETNTFFASTDFSFDTGTLTPHELISFIKLDEQFKLLTIKTIIYITYDFSFEAIDCYSVYFIDNLEYFESWNGPSAIYVDGGYSEVYWGYKGNSVQVTGSDSYINYFSNRILIPYDNPDENGIKHYYLLTENGLESYPGIPGVFGEKFDFQWFSIEFQESEFRKLKIDFKFELEESKLK